MARWGVELMMWGIFFMSCFFPVNKTISCLSCSLTVTEAGWGGGGVQVVVVSSVPTHLMDGFLWVTLMFYASQ